MKLTELFNDQTLPDIDICNLTDNSRKVKPGFGFFCIKGNTFDGHDFAAAAQEQGASAIVCERDLGLSNQIIVPDSRVAYAHACAAFFGRPANKLRLIGVTGTNGKTTVTHLLKQLLEQAGYKTGLIGTMQNIVGDKAMEASFTTPDPYTLQSLFAQMAAENCVFCVMEVSSMALDQKRVETSEFETAVFTNLTQDHLDYHGTMEAYLNAKRKLFFMTGQGVINLDDPFAEQLIDGIPCETITYSIDTDLSDYTAKNVQMRADGVDFELVGKGVIGRVKLPIPGLFSVYNAMAAAACAFHCGLSFDQVITGLAHVRGVKGRAEVVETGRDFTVVIDYAHTPDGLINILKTMKRDGHRLICLFGCGGDRDKTKRPKMAQAAAQYADGLIITSDNPRSEDPDAIIADIQTGLAGSEVPHITIPNRKEAIFYAIQHAEKNDIIVLAGKGHETYQILKDETIRFDEREIVQEALKIL